MKIAIGCDHGGYLLKQDILIWLEEHNIDFEDVGCYSTESVDYPMYGEKVGRQREYAVLRWQGSQAGAGDLPHSHGGEAGGLSGPVALYLR